MGTCKTCSWWGGPILMGKAECRMVGEGKSDKIMVSGWEWDSVETAPDFGCTEHSPKDTDASQ